MDVTTYRVTWLAIDGQRKHCDFLTIEDARQFLDTALLRFGYDARLSTRAKGLNTLHINFRVTDK